MKKLCERSYRPASDGFLRQQSVLELSRPPNVRYMFQFPSVIETKIYNKVNIDLKNVHFICSIDAFKASNNRISNKKLSETTQNPVRFFERNILTHSVKAAGLGYMRKKDRKLRSESVDIRSADRFATLSPRSLRHVSAEFKIVSLKM